jgi:endonuclease YncB( thermonuclease family)
VGTIEQLNSGLVVGHVGIGMFGGKIGSIKQETHDGDTLSTRALGDLGIRFLGVDAPEISFDFPGDAGFVSLGNAAWEDFLSDPFSDEWDLFEPMLDAGLRAFLVERVGPGTAQNHHLHAQAAEDALEEEVEKDLAELEASAESFEFFLAFAYEVMDGYGRLLAYINRNQPDADFPTERPVSYNERLLARGMVLPYFIWPNVDPFRSSSSLRDAVPDPANPAGNGNAGALHRARTWVKEARANEIGLFDANAPLRLESFELRFLARRKPPDRWVIDLNSEDGRLLPPQNYYTIPNPEDRLFVPDQYVPLFEHSGWRAH